MAILWMESFDFYGTSLTNLGYRGYLSFPNVNISIVSNPANARTGNGYINIAKNTTFQLVQKPLDNISNECGQGAAFNWLSTENRAANVGLYFGPAGNVGSVRIVANGLFGVSVWQGTTFRGLSPNNLWVVGSYNWLEAKVTAGVGTGAIEVKLNGQTVVTLTGLTISPIEVCAVGKFDNGSDDSAQIARIDDWVIWDTTGTINNDFLGDRRVVTLYPDADTIEADWTPSSGSDGFAVIDETVADDAGFITANNAGDISEFEKQPIPVDVNTVAAICPVARAFKDSAGPNTFTIGVNSAGNIINSPEFLPNTTVAYFSEIFDTNPNGDIAWTRAALDAATVRVTRVI